MQLISWSTLSQGCLVSLVTYFTLFAFKSPYLWEPNGALFRGGKSPAYNYHLTPGTCAQNRRAVFRAIGATRGPRTSAPLYCTALPNPTGLYYPSTCGAVASARLHHHLSHLRAAASLLSLSPSPAPREIGPAEPPWMRSTT
jgi:hypothetical protein